MQQVRQRRTNTVWYHLYVESKNNTNESIYKTNQTGAKAQVFHPNGNKAKGDLVLGWLFQKTWRQGFMCPRRVRKAGQGKGGWQTRHNFSKVPWREALAWSRRGALACESHPRVTQCLGRELGFHTHAPGSHQLRAAWEKHLGSSGPCRCQERNSSSRGRCSKEESQGLASGSERKGKKGSDWI